MRRAAAVNKKRSGIRPRLRDGEERRYAQVDEADPDRVRLRAVIELRGAWRWDSGRSPPRLFELACDAFVADNLGLAIDFARGLDPGHVPEADVIHAAAVGMITALYRFDLSKAGKFSTYAVWWMKHETGTLIHRAEAGAGVPVPGTLRDDKRELEAAARVLAGLLRREPEDGELARALAGAPRRKGGPNPARWTQERVRQVREAYVGYRRKALDRRAPAPGGEDPEYALDLRRALARLPLPLRRALAEEHDLGEVPEGAPEVAPEARALLADLAVRRLRELMGEG